MQQSLDACRWVYNKTLEVRRDSWREYKKPLSLYETSKMLTRWKQNEPWLYGAFSQCLQEAQHRVDLAFRGFFRRVHNGEKKVGYPRFKGDWYKSFTYPQRGFKFLDDGRLYLSKIGPVKIKLHRPIEGQIKTLTIKRNSLGNWYASFSCEVESTPLPHSPKTVGIDVGLTHFATLSDGEQIANPRFFRKDEKALAKAQHRLSRAAKGTQEYRKRKRVVQHIHQRIANRRGDFAHKLSRRLVDKFQVIVFEDLNIQDMQNGNWRSMNKSISDAAWRQFMDFTIYKAESAGRTCIKVDPRNTTQMCSSCGRIVKKDLSVRVHECPYCGLKLDRDHNAALNILARGLSCLRADSSVTGRSCAVLTVAE